MVYSFDLGDFETGAFVATRYAGNVAVSGDWVCRASSDEEALRLVRCAADEEWCAPDTREAQRFTVEFRDA